MKRSSVVLLSALVATGCQSSRRPPLMAASELIKVQYQDQAARGGLAVISVAPWDDYVASLQPAFALTPEQALAQSLPVTSRQTSDLLDALAFGLKLAPPTSSRSETSSSTTQDGVTTSERTETSTRQPGDVSQITLPDMPTGGTVRRPAGNSLDGPIEVSGPTRYAAATALYQEVQLLNSYVQDAALAAGKQAFVVRLQVSLLPQLRGQAYDAYTTLSFLVNSKVVATPYAVRSTAAPTNASAAKVSVLPILVTDSLEQSFADISASRTREFAFGLLALIKGFGASADLSRNIQQLQSAIGADYNALQTITKVTDNSIRVRFGAQHQIGSGLAMIPRNHNVTAVLLVDKPESEASPHAIAVLSKTEVVRATDGFVLDARPFSDLLQQRDKVVQRYLKASSLTEAAKPSPATPTTNGKGGPSQTAASTTNGNSGTPRTNCPKDGSDDHLSDLAYAAMANDREKFNCAAVALKIDEYAWSSLWSDLVEVGSRSPYASTSFELPQTRSNTTAVANQSATVLDDGKSSGVRIRGVKGIAPAQLSAYLTLKGSGRVLPGTVAAAGPGTVDLTFPSLQKLALCKKDAACAIDIELYRTYPLMRWTPDDSEKQIRLKGNVDVTYLAVPEEEEAPPEVFFNMTVGAQQIVRSTTGSGTVRLVFQRSNKAPDEPMFFTLSGADVDRVMPDASATLTRHGWKINAPPGAHAAITLHLTNLSDEADVRITANNEKAKRAPIVLRVRTTPPQPK